MTLHGSRGFTLADSSGLFVSFATADFGQDSGFFAGAFEATQRDVERLVITYFNSGHEALTYLGN